ncbi:hypothetical protein EYW49_19615 [Siculibacillus lacustris]|uniref:Uncharacterized protein n=1 Tax=Siculibacillus lacustris TaxID=1549641 RepID=A0A4V2KSP6_9HYPH|nr:hypothetical protein [Siculibacillus lacustris]TBW33809.1 hypothetical protein EYW49_19615 [Siculibacillus lacustris]
MTDKYRRFLAVDRGNNLVTNHDPWTEGARSWGGSVATTAHRIAFQRIAAAALARSDAIVSRWLPDGRREGAEWVARNPRSCPMKWCS